MRTSRKKTILLLVLMTSVILSYLPIGIPTPVASVGVIGNRQLSVGETANGTLNNIFNPSDYYSLSLAPGYYNITVHPASTLRSQLVVSRWERDANGPTTVTVSNAFAYPSGSVSAASAGLNVSLVLTVIPPYYDYSVLVSRLSATSGAYNITVTEVSGFQPLNPLPATFSQTLTQGHQALCKFNVTGPYIYNFTLSWSNPANNIIANVYQIGDQAQMVVQRLGITNSVRVTGVFYPIAVYPMPTYVVVRGSTISTQNETFSLNILNFSSRGNININGSQTSDTIINGNRFFYALQLPLGNYYNFYLATPPTIHLDLYIHSPQTGNPGDFLTRGTLESTVGSLGASENITNVVMFEQYAVGIGPDHIMQFRYGFGATPNALPAVSPYRVLVEVACDEGTGGTYNLTVTSRKFATYTPGATGNLILNASKGEQSYYALSESIANVYSWNVTWKLNTSIGGGNSVGLNANLFVPATESPTEQLGALHTAIMATNGFAQPQQIVNFMWGTYGAANLVSTTYAANTNGTNAEDWACFRDGTRYIGFSAAEVTPIGEPTSLDNSSFTISFRANTIPPKSLGTSAPVNDIISSNSARGYSMNLVAGHTYDLRLVSGSINPSMVVIDQNGMIATSGTIQLGSPVVITEPQGNNEYDFLVQPGATGTYYLIVFTSTTEGNYVVSLQDIWGEPIVGNALVFIGAIAITALVGVALGFLIGKRKRI